MRHSARLVFLALLALGAFGTVTTGAAMYIRILYLSIFLLGGAILWAFISLRGIRLRRSARSLRASVGDLFEETFEIQNDSRLPRLWLEVINQSPLPQAAGSRLLTLLNGKAERTYQARTWLTQRGAYTLGPTRIASGDPFGLFTVSRKIAPASSLLVLPLILPLEQFGSPPGLLPGGKAIRQKSAEVTPHASGVREYTHGDPLKSIHWPSTARRGKIMVKEFERDPQAEIWLFLDAQNAIQAQKTDTAPQIWQDWMFRRRPEITLPPSTLEYGISIAASLAHYYIAQRRAVGLVTGAPVYTVIPAERSERQESKILETLAFLGGKGELPLLSLVESQSTQMPLGSSALLITPATGDGPLLAVDALQRRNLRPVVILLLPETFGGLPGGETLAEKLLARRIPVCKIACGNNLTHTLSGFSATPEIYPWQTPPSPSST